MELNQQLIDVGAGFAAREANITAMVETLNAEKLAVQQKADAAIVELDRQDQFKANIIDVGVKLGMGFVNGTLDPLALIPLAVGAAGFAFAGGTTYDNKRKDKVIAEKKV